MTRVAVPDLVPATAYKVQVRAVSDGQYSEWSESFTFTTSQNSSIPAAPATVTWTVQGDGFLATWTEVTLDIAGNAAVIDSYELELTAGATVKNIGVVAQKGQSGSWALDFQGNTALFGTPQPSISLRVRAVNNKGIKGNWSGSINASNAVPANVTGFTGTAQLNGVDLSWTPNTDTDLDHYEVFVGTTSGFTPTTGNRIFTGIATHFFYVSTTYTAQYFKIRAIDKFGQASATDAQVGPFTPTSPFVVDSTAPSTPTSLGATITNNANGIGATAAVTWVMTSPPSDLAGYNIRYRAVSTSNYEYMNGVDQGVLAATVTYLQAFTNYEFQIQAYDFSYNKSAWSSTYTATSPSNAVPANVTGLAATPGKDSIIYTWTAVADTDIKNYEVTFSTSPTFASGNVTYLTGTSTTLTVAGLAGGTTYYARVRAVDTAGQTSASFSSTVSATTGTTSATDGSPPGSSPTPSVVGRLNSLYVTWTPVTNNDPVTYEVHLSTTTGFTPSGGTKVTEISGASAMVSNLPGTTTALSYGTTYFIKLIAKDADGAAAAGSQGSGSISKVASTDVTSIGADLIVPGTGFVNALVVNTGGSIQSSNYVSLTTGWKISPTGIEMNDAGSTIKVDALEAGTIGGVSGAGVIQVGAGTSINMNGGYLKSNTYTGTSAASNPSGAGFYLGNDGLRIDQGTVSAAALATGTVTATTITLGSGGSITAGSWTINNSGITIPNGAINAASLNLQIGNNLLPPEYADFEALASVYSGTNALLASINATATVTTSQRYFNSQALSVVFTNTSNQVALGTSVVTPDYNMNLNPGSTYIISAYMMQPTTGTGTVTIQSRIQYQGFDNAINMLTNGNFEATPSNSGWTTNGTIGTVSTNQVTQRLSGFKGQQLTQAVTGADTYISQTVTVLPNTQYTFAASRIVNTTLTGGALSNRSIWWNDGTGSGGSGVLNATTPTGSWVRDSVTFTTSVSATTVTLRLYAPNGTVFWDDAVLVPGAVSVPDNIITNGGLNVPNNGTWARYSWTFTMPASTATTGGAFLSFKTVNPTLGTIYFDGIQVEEQLGSVTTPSTWKPSSSTTIDGGIIRTGSIISSTNTTVNGNSIPVWSIPLNGAASFANLQVRGSAVFGNPTGGVLGGTDLDGGFTTVSSANYIPGTQGWQLRSNGTGELVNLGAQSINGANITAGSLNANAISSSTLTSDIVISGSFTTSLQSIQLPSLATTSGSATVTVVTPDQFYPDDVGSTITSANLPANTTIIAYLSATSVTVSANASATGTDAGASILRNRRVVIDSNGVTLITQANNAIIVLPTDPAVPATFNGVVNANTLSVSDYFYMGGINNALQTNAVLGMSLGTFVPSAPQLTASYDNSTWYGSIGPKIYAMGTGLGNAGANLRGFYYDPTDNKYYWSATSNFWSTTTEYIFPSTDAGSFNAGTGWDGTHLIWPQGLAAHEIIMDIASDASNFYVLTQGTAGSGWKLYTMTRANWNLSITGSGFDGVPVTSTATVSYATFGCTSSNISPMGMAVYGGNIYLAARRADNNKMQLNKYTGLNFTTLAFSNQLTSYSTSTDVFSLSVGKFDMGGTNVYAAVGAWGPNRPAVRMVLVGASAFTHSQTLDFPVPTSVSNNLGTTYFAATTDTSTGVFKTLGAGGNYYSHTGFGAITTGTNFNATMKWRNDNTGGGTAGVGPSSPTTSVSLLSLRRAKVVFTSPKTIPNAGGNTPNSVSFYGGVDAGTKWHYPELATNIITASYTTLQTSDAATIPAVMGVLVSGSPAQITNGTTTAGVAGALNILGNGTAVFGTTTVNTLKIGTAGATMTGRNYGNTTANTNASGQITIAHGLGVNPVSVVAMPGSNHQVQLASKDATNMVFTCYTRPGVILGTGISVQILWEAMA